MNLVFMGTPEFAVPSLEKLLQSKHKIAAVVTAPDKERGRGRQLSFTPVKEFALKNNLEVLSPISLREEGFINRLKEIKPDLFVVVAFRILPQEVYTIPGLGSFNLHGSLLPKYRGAAPIQWAVINGEKETGVTTFFLEEKVDTGNIILQKKLIINDDDDYGAVHDRMMILGAEAIMKTIDMIDSGMVNLIRQDDSLASAAPKITKEICEIDWNKSAEEIHNLVRGLSPYPGAYFTHKEKIYKVFKTAILDYVKDFKLNFINTDSSLSGRVMQTKDEIFIQTGNGVIQIFELQPEGRKRITAAEFLRGNSFTK